MKEHCPPIEPTEAKISAGRAGRRGGQVQIGETTAGGGSTVPDGWARRRRHASLGHARVRKVG
jgi:hypothetical protein